MKKYDWKEKYYNSNHELITSAAYFSKMGTISGSGSKIDPFNEKIKIYNSNPSIYILGGGTFDMEVPYGPLIVGQSPDQTRLKIQTLNQPFLKDLTLESFAGACANFQNCIVKHAQNYSARGITALNSVFYGNTWLSGWQYPTIGAITFVDNTSFCVVENGLYNRCTIRLDQATINAHHAKLFAFNECKFEIGSETEATPLSGSNADELRQDFIRRCTEQGINLQEYNEYREKNKMGRWIFSNNSIVGDYKTLEGSEIDLFAKKRGIYFGHTSDTVHNITISDDAVSPMSFTPETPVDNIIITDNSIQPDSFTLNDKSEAYADSNIIWLGAEKKLDNIHILHSFASELGISIDNVSSFGDPVSEDGIEADELYIIRSSDSEPASIKYADKIYDSSLDTRNHIFRGINGISGWTVESGNPVILPITDVINYQTVQIRLVSEIPTPQITNGSLQPGYWYFIAPDDLSDTSGTVTYKGKQYPCYGSFLTDDDTSFAITRNCHLRRCWRQNYNDPEEEITDKSFWENKQKPKYFDVLPEDMRCFKKEGLHLRPSPEMETDENGNYIASGHPDFYSKINSSPGYITPLFPITGAFMQLRIPITSQNPM